MLREKILKLMKKKFELFMNEQKARAKALKGSGDKLQAEILKLT